MPQSRTIPELCKHLVDAVAMADRVLHDDTPHAFYNTPNYRYGTQNLLSADVFARSADD